MRAGGQHFESFLCNKLICRGKTDYLHQAETGFLCEKSPPTAAVLRPEIRDKFYMCKVQFLCRIIIMWFMNIFRK
jgi:hypothetical protein